MLVQRNVCKLSSQLFKHNLLLNPIIIRNNVIEQVKCYKILGVILSDDLNIGIVM